MLIAVASKDSREINEHFGHAERFLVYDVNGADVSPAEERQVEKYCSYDPEHPLRRHILADIAEALQGCRAIVCSQIGQAPQEEMARLGFDVFTMQGEIRPALLELVKVL
jgi:predicted Fe-Mo cluster-binding NifX family protein